VIEIATNVVAVRESVGVDLSPFEKIEELSFSRRDRFTSLNRTVSHYPSASFTQQDDIEGQWLRQCSYANVGEDGDQQ
jgi:hypothetical protein